MQKYLISRIRPQGYTYRYLSATGEEVGYNGKQDGHAEDPLVHATKADAEAWLYDFVFEEAVAVVVDPPETEKEHGEFMEVFHKIYRRYELIPYPARDEE